MGDHDWWVAECVPCKWALIFDTEDEAISAAVTHVAEHHADMDSNSRGQSQVGHVQLRTIDVIPGQPFFPPAPALMDAAPYVPAPATAGTVAPGNNVAELVAALIKMFIPAKE